MGPATGASQLLTTRRGSSPLFAALVNAAASHVVEQDDLHNSSVLHPATVVFPAILAMAQCGRFSGKALITAAVAGYETGVRVGEFLGRGHYEVFHTTGTAGTPAAAAAVGNLLELDAERMGHALGSAGTQAAGLWEFLRDAADSKQLHTAKAAADGLTAACLAAEGMTAARQIFEGAQGMGAGMRGSSDAACLTDRLGSRWAMLETSFKFHASCRHTHPAADALLQLAGAHELDPARIERIRAHVYQAAADVLGTVVEPRTVHQAKFSMGFVLALIARYRRAGVDEFTDSALRDPVLRDLHRRVEMIVDPDIDALYPRHWAARVEVDTVDGETLTATVQTPKGDPENPLTSEELEFKAHTLAAFGGAASRAEMDRIIDTVRRMPGLDNAGDALRLPARDRRAA
jgi:2-methylcitrate dehydratase PrpD